MVVHKRSVPYDPVMKPVAVQSRVVCVGEILVDFLPDTVGARLRDVHTYHASIGGSPANTAVGLARRGVPTAVVARVGDDEFGGFLRRRLAEEGVDIRGLVSVPDRRTGLLFLEIGPDGERSCISIRDPGGAAVLCSGDLDEEVIAASDVLHLSSNAWRSASGRKAIETAVACAQRTDTLLCVDANIRVPLWASRGHAKQAALEMAAFADILKVNESEARLMTGAQVPTEAARRLQAFGPAYVVVTLGEQGCVAVGPDGLFSVSACSVDCVDTTGAGDAFVAGVLASWLHVPGDWEAAVRAGNEAGAAAVRHLGATGLPA